LSVVLDTIQEFLTALGVLDMFDAEVHTLFHVTATDLLVDDHTDSGLGDVVDNTGTTGIKTTLVYTMETLFEGGGNLPVVELVGHTLLDSSVGLDINDISNLVGLQVGGQGDGTMFAEVAREHVAGASTN
jgi:hypothetical protein